MYMVPYFLENIAPEDKAKAYRKTLGAYPLSSLMNIMFDRGLISSSLSDLEALDVIRLHRHFGPLTDEVSDDRIKMCFVSVDKLRRKAEEGKDWVHEYYELYPEELPALHALKQNCLTTLNVWGVEFKAIRGGVSGEKFASLYSFLAADNEMEFLLEHFNGKIFRHDAIEQAEGGKVVIQYLPHGLRVSPRSDTEIIDSSAHGTDGFPKRGRIGRIFYEANGFFRDNRFPLVESENHEEHLYVPEDLWVNLTEENNGGEQQFHGHCCHSIVDCLCDV